ncbi:hypothetical protein GCM10025772_01040 [Ferrimonas gelatinilytica]|uniref:Smp protein n=2 Tax=Ferrimonas gelatinilytica TaxID=1255257 RepID=A0ABP9RTD6_9GAMM
MAITLALFAAVLIVWQQQRQAQQQQLDREALALTQQLLTHASFSAAAALKRDDDELLQWVVESLVKNPKILSASLFDYQGHQLGFAQRLFPEAHAPEPAIIERSLERHRVLTTPVLYQDEPLGYLRIRVNQRLYFYPLRQMQKDHFRQLGLLLLLSGLVGWLLGRTLSVKRAGYSYRMRRARQIKQARSRQRG